MSIRVTITKPNVTDAYGLPMVVGSTYTVNDDFGLSLIQQGKASDTDASLTNPGVREADALGVVYCNAATLAAPTAQMLASYNTVFALDVAPFTRYRSNGTYLVPEAQYSTDSSGNITGLAGPSTIYFPHKIYSSGALVTAPADTNENTLATCTLPGGTLGPNGFLEVMFVVQNSATPGNITPRIRLGGTVWFATVYNSNTTAQYRAILWNKNSQSANFSINTPLQFGAPTTNVDYNTSIDTSVNQTLLVTGQKATGGDTLSLRAVAVFAHYGP